MFSGISTKDENELKYTKVQWNQVIKQSKARNLVVKALYFPKQGNLLHLAIQKTVSFEYLMFYSPEETENQLKLQQQNANLSKPSKNKLLEKEASEEEKKESILFPSRLDKENLNLINQGDEIVYEDKGVELVETTKKRVAFSQLDYRIYEEIREMRKELKQERGMRNLARIMQREDDSNDQNENINNKQLLRFGAQEDDSDEDDDIISMSLSDQMYQYENDEDFYRDDLREEYNYGGSQDEERDQFRYFRENESKYQLEEDKDTEEYKEENNKYQYPEGYRNQLAKRLDDEEVEEILEKQQQRANMRSDEYEQQMIYNKQTLDSETEIKLKPPLI